VAVHAAVESAVHESPSQQPWGQLAGVQWQAPPVHSSDAPQAAVPLAPQTQP
jgi:hypothetical protein